MDPLVEIGKQIPALGVLVYLVVTFLGHSRKQSEANAEDRRQAHGEFTKATEKIIEGHSKIVAAQGEKLAGVAESNRRVEMALMRLLERQGVPDGK